MKIAVVDDHPVVAQGLETSLRQQSDFTVVGTAGSLTSARDLLSQTQPDVVLLDLRLADGSGFDLLMEARGLPAPPAFIILSSFGMPQYVDAAVRHGASGFVLKTAPTSEILDAIRRVAEGGIAFPAELLIAVHRSGWTPLSPRERRLIESLLEGRTNDEMAAALGVTRKTIEARLASLFERFGVESRTELAVRAEREGWLGVPGREASHVGSGAPGGRGADSKDPG